MKFDAGKKFRPKYRLLTVNYSLWARILTQHVAVVSYEQRTSKIGRPIMGVFWREYKK